MNHRRRAVLLLEVLTVLIMLSIGSGLMFVAVSSVHRSQAAVAELSSQYAVVDDFLDSFQRDVRRASSAALEEGATADLKQVLSLGEPPRRVTYRVFDGYVERSGFHGDQTSSKSWKQLSAAARLRSSPDDPALAMIELSVLWRAPSKNKAEPTRRFDLAVRCAGEQSDDTE